MGKTHKENYEDIRMNKTEKRRASNKKKRQKEYLLFKDINSFEDAELLDEDEVHNIEEI